MSFNKKRSHKCYVCGSKDGNKSYFNFPSEKSIRIEWSKFCKLNLEDVKVSDRICNEHFDEEDFRSNKQKGGRWLLKKNAIPKILEGSIVTVGVPVRGRKQCYLCRNRNEPVSFHFPEDVNLREKWLEFCGAQADSVLPSDGLCSKHFLSTDIEGGVELKKDAVPTVATRNDLGRTEASNKRMHVRRQNQSCYLCGKGKEPVSSFKFPKDINVREKWLEFCGAQAHWILPSHRLCAKHFLSTDIDDGVIPRLKRNAVPTINIDSDDDWDDEWETTGSSYNRYSMMPENTHHCSLCGTVRDKSTFRFPKCDELKQKWMAAMGLEGQSVPEFATICTMHFTEDSYEKFGWSNRTKLKENVIPSIFTSSQLEFAKKYLSRKRKHEEDEFEISCVVEIHEEELIVEDDSPVRVEDPQSDIQKSPKNVNIPAKSKLTQSKPCDPKNKVQNSVQPIKRNKMEAARAEANTDPKSNVKNDASTKKPSTRVEGSEPDAQKAAATILVVQYTSDIPKTKNAKLKPSPGKRKSDETETSSSVSSHLIDHQYGVDNDSVTAASTDTLVSTDLASVASSSEPKDQEILEDVVPDTKLRRRYRYVGDFRPADFEDPEKVENCFKTLRETLTQKNKSIKTLKQKVRRLENKVGDLKSLVNYLYKLSHK